MHSTANIRIRKGRTVPIDTDSSRAIVRAAEYLRRERMDKPAKEVVEYARAEARREMIEALMRKAP